MSRQAEARMKWEYKDSLRGGGTGGKQERISSKHKGEGSGVLDGKHLTEKSNC